MNLRTQHQRGVAVQLAEDRLKIEEVTHTLNIRAWHTCFLGLHTDLFVRSQLPEVTPLSTWFLDADLTCPTPRPEYHPVTPYHLSRCPELTYRKSVVWAFGSFPGTAIVTPRGGKRMSQIPAMFPRIPFAVDYCGFSCCLSSQKRVKKGCWWSSEASASALKISWLCGQTPRNQESLLNALGMETDRKANIVRSLTNLSHEADALVQRCARSTEVWRSRILTFLPYLIFYGSLFVLDVPCAPNIESSNTGRSTMNAFSACYPTLTAAWFSRPSVQ